MTGIVVEERGFSGRFCLVNSKPQEWNNTATKHTKHNINVNLQLQADERRV